MPDVLLFRTPTTPDHYAPLLASAGYTSASVPALEDEISTADLQPIVTAGAERWEALVITSRRAGEAWVRAVGEVEAEKAERGQGFVPWSMLTVYSPGPAVGTVLSSLPATWRPEPVTAISAAALAPIVLSTPPRAGQYKPYLMLVGDKTLPTLPNALAEAGRTVSRVPVYATRCAASLRGDIARIEIGEAKVNVVVLFSPSSAGYVLPLLSERWRVRDGDEGKEEIRVVAIGETTAAYLREHDWRCDGVAGTPDAEGVLRAVCALDGRAVPDQ